MAESLREQHMSKFGMPVSCTNQHFTPIQVNFRTSSEECLFKSPEEC